MNKNPKLAAFLNIVPGLGYIYLGKRIAFAITLIVAGIVTIIASAYNPLLQPYYDAPLNNWDHLTGLGTIAMIVAFMYDAYTEAIPLKSKKTAKKK